MQYECTVLSPRAQDLTGLPFAHWTVVRFAGKYRRHHYWTCQCICGTIRDIADTSLRSHRSTSCGCVGRTRRARRHGQWRTPEYHIWSQMLQRCENPRSQGYRLYGARGIRVCQAWHDFIAFFADLGPRPSPNHSLERRNNSAGYEPENCLWATWSMQNRNTRRTVLLTFQEKTQCLQDWALEQGLDARTLHGRLKHGWSIAEALTIPPSSRNKSQQYRQSHGTLLPRHEHGLPCQDERQAEQEDREEPDEAWQHAKSILQDT